MKALSLTIICSWVLCFSISAQEAVISPTTNAKPFVGMKVINDTRTVKTVQRNTKKGKSFSNPPVTPVEVMPTSESKVITTSPNSNLPATERSISAEPSKEKIPDESKQQIFPTEKKTQVIVAVPDKEPSPTVVENTALSTEKKTVVDTPQPTNVPSGKTVVNKITIDTILTKQPYYYIAKTRVGMKAGISILHGDQQKNDFNYALGINVDRFFSPKFSIGLNFEYGNMTTQSYVGYDYSAIVKFIQGSITAKYNVLKRTSHTSLSPYIGIGIIDYNSKVMSKGEVIRYVNGSPSNPTGVQDKAFPFGIEFSEAISPRLTLVLALQTTYIDSDRLDGTVGTTAPLPDAHVFTGKVVDVYGEGKTFNDLWSSISFKLMFDIGIKANKNQYREIKQVKTTTFE